MLHCIIAGVRIGNLSNLLCIVHYSAHVPELYCLMKVSGSKHRRRKRIAESSEDCRTTPSITVVREIFACIFRLLIFRLV